MRVARNLRFKRRFEKSLRIRFLFLRQSSVFVALVFFFKSAMELGEKTFQILRRFPLASEVQVFAYFNYVMILEQIVRNARHQLVERLDDYVENHQESFTKMVEVRFRPKILTWFISRLQVLNKDFFPIIARQVCTCFLFVLM